LCASPIENVERGKNSALKFVKNANSVCSNAGRRDHPRLDNADPISRNRTISFQLRTLTGEAAHELIEDAIAFINSSERLQSLIRKSEVASRNFCVNRTSRLVDGKPSKIRVTCKSVPPRQSARKLSAEMPRDAASRAVERTAAYACIVVLPGRRNNRRNTAAARSPVTIRFISWSAGIVHGIYLQHDGPKSLRRRRGFGRRVTKGSFNALPQSGPEHALFSFILTGITRSDAPVLSDQKCAWTDVRV